MYRDLPYLFEDRTGQLYGSDFDDVYDRLFYRVARDPQKSNTTLIYDMGRRASRHRDSLPLQRRPLVILDFLSNVSLGNITYAVNGNGASLPMNRYLRKTSIFGGSLSRKFTGSDGKEYRWSYRSVQGQEWTCTSVLENFIVAHFDLKPADVQVYDVSGNTLTIFEQYIHLSVEILGSLTIMRHIAQHNL